jgi:hypothetical protein
MPNMMTAANMTRPVRLAYDVDIVLLCWTSGQEGSLFSRDMLRDHPRTPIARHETVRGRFTRVSGLVAELPIPEVAG